MPDPLLARLSSLEPVSRAAQQAKFLWKRLFFWPLNALRKNRLAGFGLALDEPLPVAAVRLGADCGCAPSKHFISLSWEAVGAFASAADGATARRLTATTTAIALDRYAGFDGWRAEVSKLTQGKYHRSANKARRLGYTSRFVGEASYPRSLYELTGSKAQRSKGLFVWAALAGPRSDLVDTEALMPWPTCPRHWRICWGAFHPTESGERLAAFAMLVRSGDFVWVQQFIGHGSALNDGVTKMLMFDIMAWLLRRDDPCSRGLRWLVHGSMEEGGAGLVAWKRYLGFRPVLLDVEDWP